MAQAPIADTRVVLVTGGNKGIGLAVCKQLEDLGWQVIMGVRKIENGKEGAKNVNGKKFDIVQLDVCDKASIEKAAAYVKKKYKQLDVLVNNAGIALFGQAFDAKNLKAQMDTNYIGAVTVTNVFLPLIKPGGRIINVSSRLGSTTLSMLPEKERDAFWKADSLEKVNKMVEDFSKSIAKYEEISKKSWLFSLYGLSKGCMSLWSRMLAKQCKDKIWVAAVCPGYTATDLNGNQGPRKVEQGAWGVSRLVDMPITKETPTGDFWAAFYEDKLKEQELEADEWEQVVRMEKLDWQNPTFDH
jgi:NAD(P)-dependent dehydrogenase (short-subunit alcohol dehydrogenase family)